MRRLGFSALVLLALTSVGAPLAAQTAQKFSVQFSGLNARFGFFEGTESEFGTGGEIQFRYNPSSFSIGIGVQRTTHPVATVDINFDGVFIEPRYVVNVGSDRFAPYASARLMALTPNVEIQGVGFQGEDGVGIAGGGGILIVLGSRVNLDFGVTAGKEVYNGGAAEGATLVTRLGLAIGLF